MSIRTMSRVWEHSQHSGTDLLMLLAIADFSDDDGRAYPAVATLAKKCRMKPRNCQYILNALEHSGELYVRQNKGIRGTNLYQVNLAALGVQSVAGVQQIAQGGAMECAKEVQSTAYEPPVNHQEPVTSRNAEKPHRSKSVDNVPEGFVDFWNAYDKKNGKANAIHEWKKIKPDAALVQMIISAATSYSASREQQYRKDPERWLKGCMWEDEQHAAQSHGNSVNPAWMAGAL